MLAVTNNTLNTCDRSPPDLYRPLIRLARERMTHRTTPPRRTPPDGHTGGETNRARDRPIRDTLPGRALRRLSSSARRRCRPPPRNQRRRRRGHAVRVNWSARGICWEDGGREELGRKEGRGLQGVGVLDVSFEHLERVLVRLPHHPPPAAAAATTGAALLIQLARRRGKNPPFPRRDKEISRAWWWAWL
jgi:hypothetical protein